MEGHRYFAQCWSHHIHATQVEAVLALCMPFDIKTEPHKKQKTVRVHRRLVLWADLHASSDVKARPTEPLSSLNNI